MSESLLAPTFLFRFSVPCRRHEPLWSAKAVDLGPQYVVPSFGELEGRALWADLRAAWSDEGLLFTLRVTGKKQGLWCRASRIEDSDGLHVWISTRDTQSIHRANRFCHRFAFLPAGGGSRHEGPLARLLMINRARENPKPVADASLCMRAARRTDGYSLQAHIPASALTGFDPAEHPRLGFSYAVTDHELGMQTFTLGPEFPFAEDPNLWGTLELVTERGAGA